MSFISKEKRTIYRFLVAK